MPKQDSRNSRYEQHFPPSWQFTLRENLNKEFNSYPAEMYHQGKRVKYLPPVRERSLIGKIAGLFPSKPQGITLWGTIYYTPHYPKVKEHFFKKHGEQEALVYEFGMYSHETYHAIDQELTQGVRFLGIQIISGKSKWFLKYLVNLLKTPNAWNHPMEKPAYAFQKHMKYLVSLFDEEDKNKKPQS